MNLNTVVFDDIRLTRLMHSAPQRCASINEYSSATGIAIGRMLDLLGSALERGEVEIETAGGEAFVHTAPHGRPSPEGIATVPPNLWESLRSGRDIDTAFALWRLTRGLQQGGWDVEARPEHIPTVNGHTTFLALRFNNVDLIPLLVLPDPDELADPNGPLSRYTTHPDQLIAIATRNNELDQTVTGVRRWILTNTRPATLHVLLLEEPRYQPILIAPTDTAVAPRAVTRTMLDQIAGRR